MNANCLIAASPSERRHWRWRPGGIAASGVVAVACGGVHPELPITATKKSARGGGSVRRAFIVAASPQRGSDGQRLYETRSRRRLQPAGDPAPWQPGSTRRPRRTARGFMRTAFIPRGLPTAIYFTAETRSTR